MHEVAHNVGPNLMIGIPTLGRPVPLEWALNFKSMSPPINYNCDFNIVLGKEIGFARNALAKAALERKCKYLFFLGDDVVAPPHTLRQLIYRMENMPGVDIVGGVYCAKADPPAPLVFVENGEGSYWDWKIGEFFECTGLGMDCTLIRTSIFERVAEPWFCTVDKDGFIDGHNKAEAWTEDLYFLKKVRDVGGRIYCDGSVICEHHDVYGRRIYRLPKDSLPMRQKGVTKDKKCLVLGPEVPLADASYDITRCTQESDRLADFRLEYSNLPFDANQFDFTVVSDFILDIDKHLPEWRRVTKVGAKIAINVHSHLCVEFLCSHYKAEKNGSFIEIVNA
jgi:hypothetical protein